METIKHDPDQLEIIKQVIDQNNKIIHINSRIIENLSNPSIVVYGESPLKKFDSKKFMEES